jgi:hypothetical protein
MSNMKKQVINEGKRVSKLVTNSKTLIEMLRDESAKLRTETARIVTALEDFTDEEIFREAGKRMQALRTVRRGGRPRRLEAE